MVITIKAIINLIIIQINTTIYKNKAATIPLMRISPTVYRYILEQ